MSSRTGSISGNHISGCHQDGSSGVDCPEEPSRCCVATPHLVVCHCGPLRSSLGSPPPSHHCLTPSSPSLPRTPPSFLFFPVTKTTPVELAGRKSPVVAVLLHPGTVDTDLTRPFTAHLPADKIFTPDFAAEQLLGVIDGLSEKDNGRFIAYDGTVIGAGTVVGEMFLMCLEKL
ncbi:unnamed protein product [Closterium sp. Naga37s-1]|nr:unnamed protein product [Closterium sp. Naga37s-1]